MSDIFGGLFSGGGDGGGDASAGGGGGSSGGDFFSNLFSGGQGGSDPLSSIGGMFGGNMGMGNFDPSQMFQQSPQQAAQQGGDPGGQLAGSQPQPDQGQQGGGQGGQKGQGQPPGFFKLLQDALSGNFQKPGYNPMGGMASPAGGSSLPAVASRAANLPQQPGFGDDSGQGGQQPGQQPGASGGQPAQPTGAPGATGITSQPAGSSTEEAPIPPSRPASLDQGGGQAGGPGATTPTAPGAVKGPYADESQHGMGAAGDGGGTVPAKLGPGGQGAPGGQQPGPGGGQQGGGQQGFGQFMQSPLGQIVQALIGQMLGRMGPGGAALGQLLSPLLSQLAGQAGFGGQGGQRGSQWNPETPAIDRGRDWMNRAIPGGAAGVGRFTNAVVNAESNGKNIVSQTDADSRGRTLAQGGNPNEISQGYFQIQNHPGGTWTRAARRAGVDLNQYPSPRSAPFEVQHKVAQGIPVSEWGGRTKRLLHQQFGAFNDRMTLGQVEQQFGGGQGGGQGGGAARPPPMPPRNPYRDLGRRRRERLAEGWQF
jgi:hypothetical protein